MNVKPPARMRVALLVTVPLFLAQPTSAQECETLLRGDPVRFHVAEDPTAPPGRFEGVFVSRTEAEVSYTPPAGEEVQTMPLDVVVGLDKRCQGSRIASALGWAPWGALGGVLVGAGARFGSDADHIWDFIVGGAVTTAILGYARPGTEWTSIPLPWATVAPGAEGALRIGVSIPFR